MQIDHIVIVAERLEDGAAFVEGLLGVPLAEGGRHPAMGTHNRLLSLGPDAYLEVIAIDPEALAPDRPRWFDLDRMSGPPRLGAWVARCDDLQGAMAEAPMGMGDLVALERGDLAWSMSVPRRGVLPFDGIAPALIQWKGARAQDRLPEAGCKLHRLILRHPEAGTMQAEWPALARIPGVTLETGRLPALEIEIVTPRGLRTLSSLTEGT